jgi:hypothetical protein
MGLIIYFENLGGLEHRIGSHLNFLIAQCNLHLFLQASMRVHSHVEVSLLLYNNIPTTSEHPYP